MGGANKGARGHQTREDYLGNWDRKGQGGGRGIGTILVGHTFVPSTGSMESIKAGDGELGERGAQDEMGAPWITRVPCPGETLALSPSTATPEGLPDTLSYPERGSGTRQSVGHCPDDTGASGGAGSLCGHSLSTDARGGPATLAAGGSRTCGVN